MPNLLIPQLKHYQFSSLCWIYRNIYREKSGNFKGLLAVVLETMVVEVIVVEVMVVEVVVIW